MAKKIQLSLPSNYVVAEDTYAYFVGGLDECAAYAKGYNEAQVALQNETVCFQIYHTNDVQIVGD